MVAAGIDQIFYDGLSVRGERGLLIAGGNVSLSSRSGGSES